MACGSCRSSLSRRVASRRVEVQTVQEVPSECSYTKELMLIWQNKLKCVKDSDLQSQLGISAHKLNIALGTVNSAIHNDPCLFHKQLDKVNDIILALINLGAC